MTLAVKSGRQHHLTTALVILGSGLILVHASPGLASVTLPQPGQNLLGIYFDFDYSQNCRTAEPGEYIGCFLVLTNATAELVGGWECSILIDGAVFSQFFPTGGAVDMGEGEENFIVTLDPPLAVGRPVVLMGINILVDDDPVAYHVGASRPSRLGTPAYQAPGGPALPLNAATGSFDRPLAVINSECVTSQDSNTWGRLKNLYR